MVNALLTVPPLGASRACRLVGEGEDAGAEGPCLQELQSHPIAPLLEETLAGVHDDRVDQQPELVEQTIAQQRPNEGGAAGDRDVLAGLLLPLTRSPPHS